MEKKSEKESAKQPGKARDDVAAPDQAGLGDVVAAANTKHIAYLQPVDDKSETLLPIHEQINRAYERSKAHVVEGVYEAVRTGNLLTRARNEVEHGQWYPWLEKNCPDISPRMAHYLMKGAEYANQHACLELQTARQLFIAAGAIAPAAAFGEGEGGEGGDPNPLPTFVSPLSRTFDTIRLYYTDDRINSFPPGAAQHILTWVRKSKDEITSLEARLVKRFGDKKLEVV